MRPGLVGLGLLFAALAVGGGVSLFLVPIPTPASNQTSTATYLTTGGTSSFVQVAAPTGAGTGYSVEWRSTVHLAFQVEVVPPGSCPIGSPGPCSGWVVLQNWSSAVAGSYARNGTPWGSYVFQWENSGKGSGSLTIVTTSTTPASATLAPISEIVLGLGVAALGFVGAILLFLGFFLRGGVFRGPPAEPPSNAGKPPPG